MGYGDSDKPSGLGNYSYKSVAYDMNSLLNEVGCDGRVIVLGHDWCVQSRCISITVRRWTLTVRVPLRRGGMVAWRFADYFPHRVIAIASVCTPYMPPAQPSTPWLNLEELVQHKMPNFGYQLVRFLRKLERKLLQHSTLTSTTSIEQFFEQQETGAKLDMVAPQFFAGMFNQKWKSEKKTPGIAIEKGVMQRIIEGWIEKKKNGEQLKQPVSEPVSSILIVTKTTKVDNVSSRYFQEYDYYLSTFTKNGLQHPLNWYRTRRINYLEEQEAQLPPFPAQIPALVLSAAGDDALPPSMADNKSVRKCFPGGNLKVKVIDEADHWVLQVSSNLSFS